jgi:hypothetical protein
MRFGKRVTADDAVNIDLSRQSLELSICDICKALTMRGDISEHIRRHEEEGK